MKNRNVKTTANYIADLISLGLEINVDSRSSVKKIHVRNPRTGKEEKFAFEVLNTRYGFSKIVRWEDVPPENKDKQ